MKMHETTIVVIGGSGFIGSHLVARLAELGARVIVPTRRYERAKHLIFLPRVEVVEAPVLDAATLRRLLAGANFAINLSGILHAREGQGAAAYSPAFAAVHVELPRRIAAACAAVGVKRFLHMSALGAAAEGPSMYQRSKADGEAAARTEPSVATTIFRCSVAFGADDSFLNLFARAQKWLPVVPVPRAAATFQPVYVGDVAQAFINAMQDPATRHQVYSMGGPNIYTLAELVKLAGRYAGYERPVFEAPLGFAYFMARLFELLPREPLMNRDNLDTMKVDNVVDPILQAITAAELGIKLTPLEAIAPHYLKARLPYDDYRSRAGR
ncbi:MAG: complex I NDUFA9 subunit family protein [Pseudomonadota bacterium]